MRTTILPETIPRKITTNKKPNVEESNIPTKTMRCV